MSNKRGHGQLLVMAVVVIIAAAIHFVTRQ